ncbi:hypothetical protein FB561_2285 [Kribbella amoyensis]|uniref:Pyrroloquinoline-quinone binding quinoprotein n=1 Tax=Kribbella amoyensis TaxID=996641 RepID=A0A561BQQ4_9ACTN|nr:hypothetical protein [Kribbella amoyensis]TWD81181.1 hypothetical protein FB561_2285 [Kribbella amoyensis]
MRPTNTRLAALVASAAVAAVAIGGVLAYQQGPRADGDVAAPLVGPSTTPSGTPSSTPSRTPSTTPSSPSVKPSMTPSGPTYTGPTKVALKLSKLPSGRAPQIPYLVGREIRGGAGDPVKIPGNEQIQRIARVGGAALAVVTKGTGTELLKIRYDGYEPERIPDVTTIVTTDDQSAAAYAASKLSSDGEVLRGGTLYAEVADDETRRDKLSLPKAWHVEVIAYAGGKVWFQWSDENGTPSWNLSSWVPGTSTSTLVKTVPNPIGVSQDGLLASSRTVMGDAGTCSFLTEVATGKRLWRTCEYQPVAFTADRQTAVGAPSYQDGYADGISAALDTRNGNLLREWSGLSFKRTVVEDDQHFLIEADDGPETKGALIRCALPTGKCELATPISTTQVMLSS